MEARMDARFAQMEERMQAGFNRADERLEASLARSDERLEACFARLDAKIDSRIDASAAGLRQEMHMGFHEVNSRFDRMQQTMIRVGAGLIGVLLASGAGLIATQL